MLVGYATWSHLNFGNANVRIAMQGMSAHDFTNSILYPENFERDYPGGAWSSGNSSLPWVYPGLASIGIPVETTLPILTALEMVVLTSGAMFLLRTVFAGASPVALLALTCAFTLSYIRLGNLARFGNPFFHGHFYGYADGLRMFAIAYYLRGRHVASASILGLGFTIHPIKTLFAFIFIGSMQLYSWKSIFTARVLVPYFLFAVVACLWVYVWLGGQPGMQPMTAEEFFKYSPLYNSHWYPQDLGVLTQGHEIYITAWLSSVLFGLSALLRSEIRPDIKVQMLLGMAMICVLTSFGLAVAWFEVAPALVKISLQRSSLLVLSIATILAIGQWLADMRNRRWWFVCLASILIFSPFFLKQTWPILFTLAYGISALKNGDSEDRATTILERAVKGLIAFIVCWQIYLLAAGVQDAQYWIAQAALLSALVIGVVGSGDIADRMSQKVVDRAPGIAIVLIIAAAMSWSIENHTLSDDYVEEGSNYLAVQLWAKKNTNNDALFMTDPAIAYGWRDFSQRSSFGTLQEWYKTGWLYSGDEAALHEGAQRAARLGVEELVPERAEKRPRSEFIKAAKQRALENFYQSDGEVTAAIARDYDVQYIVIKNSNASQYGAIPPWPRAFENDRFTVVVPPHEQALDQARNQVGHKLAKDGGGD
jgi:hypothetical protein